MTERERVLARLAGRPVDPLPLMPITMMFAGDRAGIPAAFSRAKTYTTCVV